MSGHSGSASASIFASRCCVGECSRRASVRRAASPSSRHYELRQPMQARVLKPCASVETGARARPAAYINSPVRALASRRALRPRAPCCVLVDFDVNLQPGPGEVLVRGRRDNAYFTYIDGIPRRYATVPVPAPLPGRSRSAPSSPWAKASMAALVGTRVVAIPSARSGV